MAKKRAAVAAIDFNSGVAGHTKISTLILDFARPTTAVFAGRDPDVKMVRRAMSLVVSVWNAHVLAMPLWGEPEILAKMQANMANSATPPELKAMFHALRYERLTRFADMPLLVGNWSVETLPGGGFSFTCDGRLPGPR